MSGYYNGTIRTTLRVFGSRRKVLYASIGLQMLNAACIGVGAAVAVSVIRRLADGTLDAGTAWWATAVLVASVVAQYVTSYFSNRFAWVSTFEAMGEARTEALVHLQRVPVGRVMSAQSGDVTAVLTSDFEMVSNFAHHALPLLFGAVALPAVVLVVLAFTDGVLALAVGASIVVAVPAFVAANRAFEALALRRADQLAVANTRMVEYVQGIGVARSFNQTGARLRWYRDAVAEIRAVNDRMAVKLVPLALGAMGIVNLGIPLVVLVAGHRLVGADVTAATAIAFFVLVLRVYGPLMQVAAQVESLRLADASLQRIGRVMDLPEQDSPATATVHPVDASIELAGVDFAYDAGRPVLTGVDLRAEPRSMTALVGPSGAGKSTVLHLVARFWDVGAGSVRIGGVDVRDLTDDQLFDMVTIVFQDVYLFRGTIRDNIAFGRPDASDDDVRRAAAAAQAATFVEALPDAYDTMVGEGGATLSGGERQRISIARAILKGSPIVLLDEATASIDPLNEQAVQRALAELVRDRTVLVVAHRLSTIRSADRIVVLDAGRVVETGAHDELLEGGGLYARLWSERERASRWRLGSAPVASA